EVENLPINEGIEIVREWVRRLRSLQLAMGDERFVPAGDRQWLDPDIPQAGPTDTDPNYPGLSASEISHVERMRAATRPDHREVRGQPLDRLRGVQVRPAPPLPRPGQK